MSDGLPPRRRSRGGRHRATRPERRPLTTLAQAGVAASMVAGLVLAVANPALGDSAAASPSARHAAASAGARTTWLAAQQQDRPAQRDATRRDIAGVATQAVAQVSDVRTRAAQANVPAAQLAALDTLTQEVGRLVAQVGGSASVRVSRSAERASDGTPAAPGTGASDGSAPAAGTAPTAGTTSAPAPGAADAAAPSGSAPSSPAGASSDPSSSAAATPADPGAAGSAAAEDTSPTTAPTATTPGAPADGSAPDPSATGATTGAGDGAAPDPIDVTDAAALAAALPAVAADEDPAAAALRAALLALAAQVAQVDAAADAATAQAASDSAAAQAADAAAAQRAAQRSSLATYANGRIPASALCPLSFDGSALLRCDAAQAMDQLDAAYLAAFGAHLTITDSYRSYAAQVLCRAEKGYLCASPGTSNHGLGVAVDFGGSAHSFGTAAHAWLVAHAGAYGWHLPGWAQANGSKPEPWHWEYAG